MFSSPVISEAIPARRCISRAFARSSAIKLIHGHRRAVKWRPLIEADLSDKDALRRAFREQPITAVMHFAGYAYVGESMSAPGKYFTNNLSNSINLLEAMVETRVRSIVFFSTCATYGLPDKLPIAEDHPQTPINPCGESSCV